MCFSPMQERSLPSSSIALHQCLIPSPPPGFLRDPLGVSSNIGCFRVLFLAEKLPGGKKRDKKKREIARETLSFPPSSPKKRKGTARCDWSFAPPSHVFLSFSHSLSPLFLWLVDLAASPSPEKNHCTHQKTPKQRTVSQGNPKCTSVQFPHPCRSPFFWERKRKKRGGKELVFLLRTNHRTQNRFPADREEN